VERLDDADDRSEKADEGRVVADRAEEAEVSLHLGAGDRGRAGQTLFDGLRPIFYDFNARVDDFGLERLRLGQALARAGNVVLREEKPQVFLELSDIIARGEE
jgi:hypothetical protein